MNMALALVPLPAVALGYLRRKGESEDVLIILAVMSCLPIIAGQTSSVRYLGVLGGVWACWRCYDTGAIQKKSDRLI